VAAEITGLTCDAIGRYGSTWAINSTVDSALAKGDRDGREHESRPVSPGSDKARRWRIKGAKSMDMGALLVGH